MKFKELSITDIMAVVSAVALIVTVASQTYFYYRINALWVMSILSPSIYFIEVINVLALSFILIVSVPLFESIYRLLIKWLIGKRKIVYKENTNEIKILLIKKRKKYVRYFTVFSIICLLSIFSIFRVLELPITLRIELFTFFIFGLCLSLFTNKELEVFTRRITLILIIICVTALNAEIKIAYLKYAPIVYLKNENYEHGNKNRLLQSYQDNVVIFEDQNSKLVVRVSKIDQVEKIEEYEVSN